MMHIFLLTASNDLVEPVAELRVALVHVVGVAVAAVQLDVVNPPRLKLLGVLLHG